MARDNSIAIAGASGFVGRHLTAALLDKGYKVECLSRHALEAGPSGACFQRINSLFDEVAIRPVLQRCSCLVHLAGLAHSASEQPYSEYHSVNVEGTRSLLALARESGVGQFIYLSSLHSICTVSSQAVSAETSSRPDSFYGRSKLAAEQLIGAEAGPSISWTIILPALVYGPGNSANMARLIEWVRAGRPLPLGCVENRRSFVYVKNLVDLIVRVIEKPEQAHSQRLLVSDGDDVSSRELVLKIADSCGVRPNLWPVPGSVLTALMLLARWVGRRSALERLISSLYVDISSTKELLAWSPPYSLDQGLQETLASYAD